MFGLSVITAVSLIGSIWFNSFQNNLYVLLSDDRAGHDQKFFAGNEETPSILSNIGATAKDLRAAVYSLIGLGEENKTTGPANTNKNNSADDESKAYPLPLSGSR